MVIKKNGDKHKLMNLKINLRRNIGFWGRLSAQLGLVGKRAASALPSGGGNLNSTHTFVSGSGNLISTSTFAFLRDHAQDSTHTRNSVHFHLQSGD